MKLELSYFHTSITLIYKKILIGENYIGHIGPKRDANGEWRRLRNEELHSLYRTPNIVRVIKYRRLKWAGNVARMEDGRSASKY